VTEPAGLTEIAGLELDGPKILNGWNLQDRNTTNRLSGVEFAGLESDGPTDRGGICRTDLDGPTDRCV
jgi:hypothetical protein